MTADIELQRSVFFVSDGTGITAETLGYTLLSQFAELDYQPITIPFVDTVEKADRTVAKIEDAMTAGARPLVFASIVNPDIRKVMSRCEAKYFDLFKTFIPEMEAELGMASAKVVGQSHSMKNTKSYNNRIEAVNYALSCDDGVGAHHYENAELILLGVSRCGKTPTSLYLALHFGLFVANYPFTQDDFPIGRLPDFLQPFRDKLFGLTIKPDRLQAIRQERRANSLYASTDQCLYEVAEVEKLFRRDKIPFINTTNHSIEEISARILSKRGLRRQSY